jgi:hypothetical protein
MKKGLTAKIWVLCVLMLAFLAAGADGQTTVYFDGKITEISKAVPMGLGQTGTFYILRLDSKPGMEFRLSRDKALKYGLIEAGAGELLGPKQLKGLGWKVKLTCTKEMKPFSGASIYQVEAVQRLSD